MTLKLTLAPNNHPGEDIFENYSLGRLSEEETLNFEEHLLICERCQDTLAETDEYIQLMKAATAAYAGEHGGGPSPQVHLRRKGVRWNAAGAAAALLLTCLTALLSWRTPLGEPRPIILDPYRGAASQAPAEQPLDLKIDLSDVQPAAGYRVEIVDATGRRVWFGGTPARLTKGLPAGVYWVRLSTVTGDPLREYGLNTR